MGVRLRGYTSVHGLSNSMGCACLRMRVAETSASWVMVETENRHAARPLAAQRTPTKPVSQNTPVTPSPNGNTWPSDKGARGRPSLPPSPPANRPIDNSTQHPQIRAHPCTHGRKYREREDMASGASEPSHCLRFLCRAKAPA